MESLPFSCGWPIKFLLQPRGQIPLSFFLDLTFRDLGLGLWTGTAKPRACQLTERFISNTHQGEVTNTHQDSFN